MSERSLFAVPTYFPLAAMLERRGGDLIALSRKITAYAVVSKSLGAELEEARLAALDAAQAIARYQRGEAYAEETIDKVMSA